MLPSKTDGLAVWDSRPDLRIGSVMHKREWRSHGWMSIAYSRTVLRSRWGENGTCAVLFARCQWVATGGSRDSPAPLHTHTPVST